MSATRILPLHFFRSAACSFFNRRDFMSCCVMSPHRFFCRPRLRRPLTSAVIFLFMEFRPLFSSHDRTYHRNLASRILSVMHACSTWSLYLTNKLYQAIIYARSVFRRQHLIFQEITFLSLFVLI